ncbi:50S ribosomal protein L10, partial [Patescibacteria group bacterium]|nr:50S ribosomal protein L10 [Patescibacteria group bacterium]
EKIKKSRSIIFADYTGLKHKQLETLRKNLKKTGAEFVVVKNKLLERSLRQAQGKPLRQSSGQALGDSSTSIKSLLKENTATLFNYDDEAAGLKELLKFFKLTTLGKAKGGLLGNTVLTDSDVDRLTKLPSRQALLGQLAGQLMAPLSGLHYALSWNINKLVWGLNAVKNKNVN